MQEPTSGQSGSDALLEKAESVLADFTDRMLAAGWTTTQSLDAVAAASARLRVAADEDPDPADDGSSATVSVVDEPSNDWPSQ